MNGLKLTVCFGERAGAGAGARGGFLADALADIFVRHDVRTSLVIRAAEGFGAKHALRDDRRLTLSEDLPLVAVAVDDRPRVEAALAEVDELRFGGLVTLEPVTILPGSAATEPPPPSAKLTVYVGRHERIGGQPADRAIVDRLARAGVAGATVLLGVDGTLDGTRRRARFLGRNALVPSMVLAVGDGPDLVAALGGLGRTATLEEVRVCKYDGQTLAEPARTGSWQRLTVYAGEQSRHRGQPLAPQLVRELRAAGAAGATSMRGVWGFHGDHPPHGDRFWQLARRVPVVTMVVDAPARIPAWFEIVDRLTDETGLVTSEIVPVARSGSVAPV